MLHLVPSSMLLWPVSPRVPRESAENQDRGSSMAKKDPETPGGCSAGSTRRESQLCSAQEAPSTEGLVKPHGRDVSDPANPSALGRLQKPTPESSSSETSTEAKSSHKPLPAAEKEPSQPLLDFSPLKDPVFFVFTWSFLFSHLAYFVPFFHLVARARTLGMSSRDGSYLIAVAGRQRDPLPPRVTHKHHRFCRETVPDLSWDGSSWQRFSPYPLLWTRSRLLSVHKSPHWGAGWFSQCQLGDPTRLLIPTTPNFQFQGALCPPGAFPPRSLLCLNPQTTGIQRGIQSPPV